MPLSTIDAMVANIEATCDHVHVLFYIWLPDNNGPRIAEAFKRMANFVISSVRAAITSDHLSLFPSLPIHQRRPDCAQNHAERLSVSLSSACSAKLARKLTDPF